ncbi:MAG: hypothetical protein ACKVTZ_14815, partial [Bacteroidia bacterium]
MKKYLLCLLSLFLAVPSYFAQCPTTNFAGNFTATNGMTMGGIYNINGFFSVPVGITIFVEGYAVNTCGALEIHADSIFIGGSIVATGAGYTGGAGGLGGTCVDSIRFLDCTLATQCLGITGVGGGLAGADGLGTGFGNGGSNGSAGSGRKSSCNPTSDRVGRVGAGGGAGSGAGASYGGLGINSGVGGNATIPVASTNSPDNFCVPANATPFVTGTGGGAGFPTALYGTTNGNDIDLGSGGGGGGGGGRGFTPAQTGGKGGNGGGLVKLISSNAMLITGAILAEGEDGGAGGKGGDAGESPRCCIDACPQVNEHTYTGAGGGGGGAGGGAGGGIWLESTGLIQITGTLSVAGGTGGAGGQGGTNGAWSYQEPPFVCGSASGMLTTMTTAAATNGAAGGHGGGGRIKIMYNSCNTTGFSPIYDLAGGGTGATQGTVNVITAQNFATGALSAASQTVCYNDTATALTLTPAYTGLTPTAYQWQIQPNCIGTFSNIAGATSPSYTPIGLTNSACYQLLVTFVGCNGLSTNVAQVNVLPQPSPITLTPSNTQNLCPGDTLFLSPTSPVGTIVEWYQNNVLLPTTTIPLAVTSAGAYMLVTYDANGCRIASNITTVNMFPSPNATINPNNNVTICSGNSVNLAVILGYPSYQWTQNGNPIGGNTNILNVNTPGTYAVTATNALGCSKTSASVVVSGGVTPVASVALSGSPSFCSGNSLTLTGSGGTTYSWYNNNTFLSTNNPLTVTTSGNYSVIVSNASGCKDTSTVTNVVVSSSINAAIQTQPSNFCMGDTIKLIASGGNTYSWHAPF